MTRAICAAAIVLLIGCGFRAGIAKTHEGIKIISREIEPVLAEECMRRARKCKADGVILPEHCVALLACRRMKEQYASGISAIHRGLRTCKLVHDELRGAGVTK